MWGQSRDRDGDKESNGNGKMDGERDWDRGGEGDGDRDGDLGGVRGMGGGDGWGQEGERGRIWDWGQWRDGWGQGWGWRQVGTEMRTGWGQHGDRDGDGWGQRLRTGKGTGMGMDTEWVGMDGVQDRLGII